MNNNSDFKDTFFCKKYTFNLGGKLLTTRNPLVMGIVNVTPDSFYIKSRILDENLIVERVGEMLNEGADLIDIGGYSSRPGAQEVPVDDEIARVTSAISAIKKHFPKSVVSIDTFRAVVAQEAINSGADLINDISGGELDKSMFETVARLKVPYILMHMKGNPANMVKLAEYDNLFIDLLLYFVNKITILNSYGIRDIIIDPGFGFAKNIKQNFELLRNLQIFDVLGLPVLAGLSRKSMIYKTIGSAPENALAGTVALNMIALQNGANVLRVHDVKEASDTVKLFKTLYF